MTITEKVSYIKGLADGLELDDSDKQSRMIKAIIDLLDDVALSVSDLEDTCAELSEQVDAIDEDLAAVEDDFYETDDFDDEVLDEDVYEVECPSCHDLIYLDDEMIDKGGIACPNCGTDLEFDFECDCEHEDSESQAGNEQ